MTSTQTKLDQAREALSLAGNENLLLFNRHRAATALRDELQAHLLSSLSCREFSWQNHRSDINQVVTCPDGAKLAAAQTLVSAMESQADYAHAIATIPPLLSEITRLEAIVGEERHQAAVAAAERAAEIEAAKAAAVAEIERKYATGKAK